MTQRAPHRNGIRHHAGHDPDAYNAGRFTTGMRMAAATQAALSKQLLEAWITADSFAAAVRVVGLPMYRAYRLRDTAIFRDIQKRRAAAWKEDFTPEALLCFSASDRAAYRAEHGPSGGWDARYRALAEQTAARAADPIFGDNDAPAAAVVNSAKDPLLF